MFSIFAKKDISTEDNWGNTVGGQIYEIEQFYLFRREILYKVRRKSALYYLCNLEGMNSDTAKLIIRQWDRSLLDRQNADFPSQLNSRDEGLACGKVHIQPEQHQLRIGELLLKAGIVTSKEINIASMVQDVYPKEKFGKILIDRGLVKPQTIDFFLQRFPLIHRELHHPPIGHYLQEAGVMDEARVARVLKLQKQSPLPVKFGHMAASEGFVNQLTVDIILVQTKDRFPIKKNKAC